MRNTHLAIASAIALAAASLAACGDNTTADNATSAAPASVAGTTPQGEAPKATPDNTAAADQGTIDFIQKAALSDMFEIEASKLALAKSKSTDIKAFAQMMIDAHTATSDAVKPIAAGLKVNPPMALDASLQGKLDDLTKADAKSFDKTYLDQQTAAHNDALGLMKGYADNGQNPDLKAFAAATAPKVQEHLDHAKMLDKGGADNAKKPS